MVGTKYPEKIYEVRKMARSTLVEILTKKPLTTAEIRTEIKKHFPKNCDDSIKCECGKGSNVKEWEHQVAWAIQDVKYHRKIIRIENKYALNEE